MQFWDIARYSFSHLKHRGLRTWLTLLGIVVGIAAVVILVGLAQGLKASVEDELKFFGPDLLVVIPTNIQGGASSFSAPLSLTASSGKLFENDMGVIRKVDGVSVVSPVISTAAGMQYHRSIVTASVMGVDLPTYRDTMTIDEVSEGRLLEAGDRKVVVFGAKAATDTFEDDVTMNSIVEISGQSYRVIGILKKTGSTYSNIDSAIMIPIEDAREIAGNSILPREVSSIRVKISPGYDPLEVEDQVNWVLLQHRKVTEDNKDFSVVSARFIQQQVDSILGTLTLFLALVSGVSLLVGAIGISNTMFMSVLERTREIGVLKSIGATSEQIERIFLVESAMIGLAGGIAGLVIGAILVQLIALLGIQAVVSPEMALVAFVFSVAVGIIAGTFPAQTASRVPAVEALRYE